MITKKILVGGRVEWTNSKRELHRRNGPAVIWVDGSKFWYKNDKLHREAGTACEFSNGDKYWYLNGIHYTEEEFNKKIAELNKAKSNTCAGKVVEIDGKKYKLVEV